MSRIKLHYKKIKAFERENPGYRDFRKECTSSRDLFDYISTVLKEEEESDLVKEVSREVPRVPERKVQEVPREVPEREAQEINRIPEREEKSPERQIPERETPPKPKSIKKKPKRKDGRNHYSSSSEDDSDRVDEEDASGYSKEDEESERKMYDDNGNEVISTSNDIWKTNIKVEQTENENMDDFINQLFM